MSETNSMPCPETGTFSWNELLTNDTTSAGNFYSKLFGWEIAQFERPEPAPAGVPPYWLFKSASRPMGVGGMMQAPQPGIPSHWMPYVVVADVEASLAQALELGGKVCLPATPIPGVGRIACIMDPQGAVIGLHELPKPS